MEVTVDENKYSYLSYFCNIKNLQMRLQELIK